MIFKAATVHVLALLAAQGSTTYHRLFCSAKALRHKQARSASSSAETVNDFLVTTGEVEEQPLVGHHAGPPHEMLDEQITTPSSSRASNKEESGNHQEQDTRVAEGNVDVGILLSSTFRGGEASEESHVPRMLDGATCSPGYSTGSGSCIGGYYPACFEASGGFGTFCVGENSCQGDYVCAYTGINNAYARIGNDSCKGGFNACFSAGRNGATFIVGSSSCRGDLSCAFAGFGSGAAVYVGDMSCSGSRACYMPKDVERSATIGSNSCNCESCCENLPDGSIIGNCQCNSIYDGCSNESGGALIMPGPPLQEDGSCPPPPSAMPSSMPSSAPSSMPSSCSDQCVASFPLGGGADDPEVISSFCTDICVDSIKPRACRGRCISGLRSGKQTLEELCDTVACGGDRRRHSVLV